MAPYFLRSASRAWTGMSSTTSYGIVFRNSRTFITVNAGFGDRVDIIIDMATSHENPDLYSVKVTDYNEDIITMLHDDDFPYKVLQLIYQSNNGSLVTGYLAYVMNKDECEQLVWSAKYLFYFKRILDDASKAIKDAVKTRKLAKRKLEEEDQEICVICQEEYRAGHMIGDLSCEHSFHEKCIRKWLNQESENG